MQARLCSGDSNSIAGGGWLALDSVVFSRVPWLQQASAACFREGGKLDEVE